MNSTSFPSGLLDGMVEDRASYFSNLKIHPPILEDVERKIHRALKQHNPCVLIMVMGPTGVGKTTLLNKVCSNVASSPKANIGEIPVASIEVPAISSTLKWKTFYKRILEALDEPVIPPFIGASKSRIMLP